MSSHSGGAGRAAQLEKVSLAAVARFFDPASGVLAEGRRWNGHAWETTGVGAANTACALVGLYTAAARGTVLPLDPDRLLDQLVDSHLDTLAYEDIAWALWADSIGPGRHLGRLWSALRARLQTGIRDSMRLAWTLASLCHYLPRAESSQEVRAAMRELAAALSAHQCRASGLFHASSQREGWLRQRRRIATLSSQSYAVYALATYGAACDDREAVRRALDCADCLVGLQGASGQWWWRYDVRRGRVAEPYPVYAVNQDSAMPLALGAAEAAAARGGYLSAARGGLDWEFGDNELGQSLVDEREAIIHRGVAMEGDRPMLMREMRSYHPGRLLLALYTAPSIFSTGSGE